MKLLFLGLFYACLAIHVFAADSPAKTSACSDSSWRLLKTVQQRDITQLSFDRHGNLLSADANGNIRKYDMAGNLLFEFSPSYPASVSLLEAWRGIDIFAFYTDRQTYTLLNRQLGLAEEHALDENLTGFAALATVANDGQIWLFDNANFSLKKYNAFTREVTLNNPLGLVLKQEVFAPAFMREYENFLFVADKSGAVYVFDLMGNLAERLPLQATFFGFVNDELYRTDGRYLQFYGLYSKQRRQTALPFACNLVAVFQKTAVLATSEALYWYSLP